jgi:hypothetical protein
MQMAFFLNPHGTFSFTSMDLSGGVVLRNIYLCLLSLYQGQGL